MPEENFVIKKHSRLGIAATVIGASLPVIVVALSAITLNLPDRHISRVTTADKLGYYFEGLTSVVLVCALPLHLVGLILALVGVFSKNTKKSFPVAGIVLNSVFGLLGLLIAAYIFLAAYLVYGGSH